MADKDGMGQTGDKSASAQGFPFKRRKPAYLAAAVILFVLLVIYLVSVYHNKHENKSPLPPKTMTKPEQ